MDFFDLELRSTELQVLNSVRSNCTPPSSVGIKNDWHCTSASACLNSVDRDDLTFTFTFPHLFSSTCAKFGVRYLLGFCEFREIGGGKLYFRYGHKFNYLYTCVVKACNTDSKERRGNVCVLRVGVITGSLVQVLRARETCTVWV